MNIVFLGSDSFAVPSLKALIAGGYQLSTVVTQPDRRKGRGLSLSETPAKIAAAELALAVYQPQDINAADAISTLKKLNPDLLIVIAYGQILSSEILAIPRLLTINLHASLLPKYRGAAPINWAIIRGEKITGVTVIKVIEKMDAGPIIMQKETRITAEDSAVTLGERLANLGAIALLESLKLIENNQYKLIPQDEKNASLAPKLKKADGLINWNDSAHQIYNRIRGCAGWPDAFTYYRGKLVKIYRVKIISLVGSGTRKVSGEIRQVSKDGIVIETKEGNLLIEELQIEGKRRMSAEEFIAGHKISVGEMLGKK